MTNKIIGIQGDKLDKINISSLIKMINKNYKNKKKINTYLGNNTLTHYY